MVELRENEALVLKTLHDLGGKASLQELVARSGLADAAVARALLTLVSQNLATEQVVKRTELQLTEEGRTSVEKGLPERTVVGVFPEGGGQMPLAEAWRCIRFTDSVACLIAEGSEFMTKEQLYDAIKNVFSRIILKAGDKDCD